MFYIALSQHERDISSNFRRTFGIFLQDLRGFIRALALATNFNLILTLITRTLIGSGVVRSAL